jgi:hypothetical protein
MCTEPESIFRSPQHQGLAHRFSPHAIDPRIGCWKTQRTANQPWVGGCRNWPKRSGWMEGRPMSISSACRPVGCFRPTVLARVNKNSRWPVDFLNTSGCSLRSGEVGEVQHVDSSSSPYSIVMHLIRASSVVPAGRQSCMTGALRTANRFGGADLLALMCRLRGRKAARTIVAPKSSFLANLSPEPDPFLVVFGRNGPSRRITW